MTFMNNTDGQIGTCGPWGQRDIFHPSYGQVKRHQEETDNLYSVWAPSSGLSGLWTGTCRYFLPNFFLCTLFLQAGLTRRKHWDLVLLRVILFYTIPRMFEYFKGQQLFTVQFCTTTCTYSALDIWSYNIWERNQQGILAKSSAQVVVGVSLPIPDSNNNNKKNCRLLFLVSKNTPSVQHWENQNSQRKAPMWLLLLMVTLGL